jgi:hypothetical protein
MTYGNANMYHGRGNQVAVILLAAMRADNQRSDPPARSSALARPKLSSAWLAVRTLATEQ